MRKNIKFLSAVAVLSMVTISGCKKSFFDRTPQSAITIDNYYKSIPEVQATTNALYSVTWFGWCGKSGWAITDLASGNGRGGSSDIKNFFDFSVTNGNSQLESAWNALFTVVAQANAVINTLPEKVSPNVEKVVVNNALGEARLWRALAYFHLVRTFGPVPIIDNSADYIKDYQVNTAPIPDIYKFMVNDLKFAQANLIPMMRSGFGTGRLSSGSASALLAKVYLYMQDYTNARLEAEKVISSGEFKLYGADITSKTYNDLFLTENNNNEESVIALQWAKTGNYGEGNPQQAAFAFNGITTTGDGYSLLAPTFDLQDLYQSGDKRRKATIMLPGDFYPEINKVNGGYTFPLNASPNEVHAAVKKYVVGSPADNGGFGGRQAAANNTYMMRYSEVYLILAEAIMNGASTSTDVNALNAINKVRNRAGLGNLTTINRNYSVANPAAAVAGAPAQTPATLIVDDILNERRRELAFENDFWFDLGRIDGYNATNHSRAIALIAQQDRGGSNNDSPPKRYGNGYVTIANKDFFFPYPAAETNANPKLLLPPVTYTFK